MSLNIYKDRMQDAEIFGKPVLYTTESIPRESVPDGWYCYDLAGTSRHPDKPATLTDKDPWNKVGTVLSPALLKRETTQARKVQNKFSLSGELLDMEGFCEKHDLPCPQDPRKYVLRPASVEEAGLFYSRMDAEQDAAAGTVGHMRMDFGQRGDEFWHTWWPHNEDQFNTPEFKEVLKEFVDEMRERGPLQSGSAMFGHCYRHPDSEISHDHFGFIAETKDYRFCLRCTTAHGDYSYLYCYDLNQQRMAMEAKEQMEPPQYGLSEKGLQLLRDAADSSRPHTYEWYVMQDSNTPEEQFSGGLSLPEAIELYASSESGDKHLGVTKDGIASVDLLITHDGQEWYSEDYQKSDSFRQDPVVADALPQIQQTLAEPDGPQMGGMSL